MSMDERDLERRFERRAGRRLVVSAIAGIALGAVAGLLVGMAFFRAWSGADIAMALGGAILFGGIGAVWGGLAGLEPADPGREPLERAEPMRDADWTVVEHPDRGERRSPDRADGGRPTGR